MGSEMCIRDSGTGNDILMDSSSNNDILFGGEGDDVLQVRYGHNTLSGDAGNDTLKIERYNSSSMRNYSNTLEGGQGADRLEGWYGSETYVFNRGDGHDVINDYDGGHGKTDKIVFGEEVNYDELWFSQLDNHLVISAVGFEDSVTIENWYASSNYQIESIQTEDYSLSHSQVDALVQAMATFDSPVGAGEEIPQYVREQLQPVLSASWQPVI